MNHPSKTIFLIGIATLIVAACGLVNPGKSTNVSSSKDDLRAALLNKSNWTLDYGNESSEGLTITTVSGTVSCLTWKLDQSVSSFSEFFQLKLLDPDGHIADAETFGYLYVCGLKAGDYILMLVDLASPSGETLISRVTVLGSSIPTRTPTPPPFS